MKRVTIALGFVVAACGGGGGGDDLPDAATPPDPELQLGGDTTVADRTYQAFSHGASNLTTDQATLFQLGNGPFAFHWIAPQLGPLFNNDSCLGCHILGGRGRSTIGVDAVQSEALVRVSLVDGTPTEPGGDVPTPMFGLQLQDHANVGLPEVTIEQRWVEHAEQYGDGTTVMMRVPVITPHTPDGMTLSSDIRMSYRQAPPLIGLGLLEAVSDATILALADPTDADADGISGRANMVWDVTRQATVLGRFGHKASEPTVRQQGAGAFANDMGLSNQVFPEMDGSYDVNDDQFMQVIFRMQTIAVPAALPQNAAAQHGKQLFHDFGCASCHVPTLTTGDFPDIPALAHQTIHPYTDLLLHDVGDLLTDARRDFLADGVEWRTPPLWGIGVAQIVDEGVTFLHDGRARTLEEAILWHGGEAMAAQTSFRNAAQQDRAALIEFLKTL